MHSVGDVAARNPFVVGGAIDSGADDCQCGFDRFRVFPRQLHVVQSVSGQAWFRYGGLFLAVAHRHPVRRPATDLDPSAAWPLAGGQTCAHPAALCPGGTDRPRGTGLFCGPVRAIGRADVHLAAGRGIGLVPVGRDFLCGPLDQQSIGSGKGCLAADDRSGTGGFQCRSHRGTGTQGVVARPGCWRRVP